MLHLTSGRLLIMGWLAPDFGDPGGHLLNLLARFGRLPHLHSPASQKSFAGGWSGYSWSKQVWSQRTFHTFSSSLDK